MVATRVKKKRISRLENDERRAQLLAMGRTAFATATYDEVSIDELAKKAKLSKGLFYYYFPTKRDLYLAGLRETAAELVGKLKREFPADMAPRQRAELGVDAYLSHIEDQQTEFLALMRGGIGSDPQVQEVLESVRSGVLDEFLRGAPISAFLKELPLARIAIRSWIGMVEAASIEWLADRTQSRLRVRDMLVDALFDLIVRVLDPRDADRYRNS
jgi:AcrR family transcriptional regulator